MRDAGHRTPDAGRRTSDIGHRTAKKAKIIYPPPRGVDIISVLPFLAKIRKFKMAAIFGEGKIFFKLPRVQCSDTLWVENFDEIALSRTVKEIEAN